MWLWNIHLLYPAKNQLYRPSLLYSSGGRGRLKGSAYIKSPKAINEFEIAGADGQFLATNAVLEDYFAKNTLKGFLIKMEISLGSLIFWGIEPQKIKKGF